jgi:hypothetical protein
MARCQRLFCLRMRYLPLLSGGHYVDDFIGIVRIADNLVLITFELDNTGRDCSSNKATSLPMTFLISRTVFTSSHIGLYLDFDN